MAGRKTKHGQAFADAARNTTNDLLDGDEINPNGVTEMVNMSS